MPDVVPDELRNYADKIDREEVPQIALVIDVRSAMKEADDPNEFIAKWGPFVEGCRTDLQTCIDTLASIARTAANRFQTTDEDHAVIMDNLIAESSTAQSSSDPGEFGKLPDTRKEGDVPHRPPDPGAQPVNKYGEPMKDYSPGNNGPGPGG